MTSANRIKSQSVDPVNNSNPFLLALGLRVRSLRNQSGTTRKTLALKTGLSERHLANLESGDGNVSVLVLLQVAEGLQSSLAELVGDFSTLTPEWLMIRSLLENCDKGILQQAHKAIEKVVSNQPVTEKKGCQIALVGLRGAGKSTLGRLLSVELGFPFIELSREVEQIAGCSIAEIQDLYGIDAYRRYERVALEQAIQNHPEAIIGIPGGLVSDSTNFKLLLSQCRTVWLKANPEDHMQRVIEQGDLRPMAGNAEAMKDLENILKSRNTFYSKAQLQLDTSQQSLQATFDKLLNLIQNKLFLNEMS
jgi:XRE family transcriptional regulator, aerobic/anaerobic benzoate catabolism transcriptional regulator